MEWGNVFSHMLLPAALFIKISLVSNGASAFYEHDILYIIINIIKHAKVVGAKGVHIHYKVNILD